MHMQMRHYKLFMTCAAAEEPAQEALLTTTSTYINYVKPQSQDVINPVPYPSVDSHCVTGQIYGSLIALTFQEVAVKQPGMSSWPIYSIFPGKK